MRYLWMLGLLLLLTGCQSTPQLQEKDGFLLDTYIKIKVVTADEALLPAAFETIERYEAQLAWQRSDSELSQINQAAGKQAVTVSDTTYQLVEQAKQLAAESDGAFDPTIGAVTKLWQIGTENPRKPTVTEIATALPNVDYHKIQLDDKQRSVYLREPGMSLDLGGIAKGYITDQLVKQLKGAGVQQGVLDLGGNLYLLGERPTGGKWRAGIKSPFAAKKLVGQLTVKNQAVVTSGGYERYLKVAGKKYSHLLDPQTGYPVKSDLASVTIVAPHAMLGDALATAVFVKGSQAGLAYLKEQHPNVGAVLVTQDRQVLLTDNLKQQFQPESGSVASSVSSLVRSK